MEEDKFNKILADNNGIISAAVARQILDAIKWHDQRQRELQTKIKELKKNK